MNQTELAAMVAALPSRVRTGGLLTWDLSQSAGQAGRELYELYQSRRITYDELQLAVAAGQRS